MSVADGTADRHEEEGVPRRDFLFLASSAVGVVAVAEAVWWLVDSMNPSADVLAEASTDVDLKPIALGQRITVVWRGKPVFIWHRTPDVIKQVEAVPLGDLIDPQRDQDRAPRPEWLVVVGVCTHLGCVPLGQRPTDAHGDWGGWFCPCHGSQYDASGRVRHGPAPANLAVPPYRFTSNDSIQIG